MTTEERDLLVRLDERQNKIEEKIDAILIQTTKTNGRLTKAEDEIHEINMWQSRLKGSYSTIVIISSAIAIIVSWILKT